MKHDISKQLPKDIQPYERCMEQGAGALNNAELLAVILRTGSVGENSLRACLKASCDRKSFRACVYDCSSAD